jgi:uncharacterized membrane protein YfcA
MRSTLCMVVAMSVLLALIIAGSVALARLGADSLLAIAPLVLLTMALLYYYGRRHPDRQPDRHTSSEGDG